MSARQLAAEMSAAIADIKAQGAGVIPCDNLLAYLDQVQRSPEPDPPQAQIERFKADLQNWIESKRQVHEGELEMFRSVITAGQGAIKSSFLLNGSAAVAMLAFIGHLAQFAPAKISAFAVCLALFAFGVLSIAVTSGATYLSQWFYASTKAWAPRVGFWLNILCIVFGLASYACFIWGLLGAYHAFVSYA